MENAETCEKSWVHVNTHTKFIDLKKKETLREKNLDRDFSKNRDSKWEKWTITHMCSTFEPLRPLHVMASNFWVNGVTMMSSSCGVKIRKTYRLWKRRIVRLKERRFMMEKNIHAFNPRKGRFRLRERGRSRVGESEIDLNWSEERIAATIAGQRECPMWHLGGHQC
jgi:hypothetical protein